MKLQTRISGLLFFLLLGLCVGNALIVREALRGNGDTQGDQVSRLNRRMQQSAAQQSAWLGAHALAALIDADLAQVSARGLALSSAPGPGEALSNRAAEPLRRVNDTLTTAGKGLRFQRLLDLNGKLALPPQPADSVAPPPFSFLEPPAPSASMTFQARIQAALKGEVVTAVESFSPDLLTHLSLEGAEASQQPSLMLLAIHPVRGPDKQVVGAIVSGQDLANDAGLLERWATGLDLKGASASILHAGSRIAVTGDAWKTGSSLAPKDWETLSSAPQRIQEKEASIVRLPLLNHEKQRVGAVEVRIPVATEVVEAGAPVESSSRDQWLQRALEWIGVLGVVALILGILGLRGQVVTLVRLSRKAEAASTGDLDASFKDLMRKDEIGDLARSFERMRISLKKLMDRQQRALAVEEEAASSQDPAGGP